MFGGGGLGMEVEMPPFFLSQDMFLYFREKYNILPDLPRQIWVILP